MHVQRGRLAQPYAAGGRDRDTAIVTLQHAGGWKSFESFLFVDHIDSLGGGNQWYGEWYPSLSLGKLSGRPFTFGPVRDIGLIAGINVAGQAERIYWLPGVRIALDLPGFAFANLDVSGYLQGSSPGPDEDDAYQIDFNWALPFELGAARFSLEGHVEFIRGADHDAGGRRASWVLAQPQLRLDLGQLLFDRADRLFVGIEYQYWRNKLGDADTDESVAQALLVWRL